MRVAGGARSWNPCGRNPCGLLQARALHVRTDTGEFFAILLRPHGNSEPINVVAQNAALCLFEVQGLGDDSKDVKSHGAITRGDFVMRAGDVEVSHRRSRNRRYSLGCVGK